MSKRLETTILGFMGRMKPRFDTVVAAEGDGIERKDRKVTRVSERSTVLILEQLFVKNFSISVRVLENDNRRTLFLTHASFFPTSFLSAPSGSHTRFCTMRNSPPRMKIDGVYESVPNHFGNEKRVAEVKVTAQGSFISMFHEYTILTYHFHAADFSKRVQAHLVQRLDITKSFGQPPSFSIPNRDHRNGDPLPPGLPPILQYTACGRNTYKRSFAASGLSKGLKLLKMPCPRYQRQK
ncbi:uncharacterized protein ARMOST_10353 [Armillaria ostoyae]|uniref:Uncharacterized protein n=1 Tax=Armillaria ostoyae TaxID=47428 RepID=A0A284RE15_ARMOS|nr:uncharacterized protein ARMOST_10353 [Armillaria ostoyae]